MTIASGVLRRRSLLFRVLAFAFAMVAGVIGVVFVLLSWQTNARLTRAVVEGMEASQRRFARIEERRGREQLLQVLALAENPTLKAAIDTYHAERGSGLSIEQLQATIQMEVIKLQQLIDVPALSVADVDGVFSSCERQRHTGRNDRRSQRRHLSDHGGPARGRPRRHR